MQHATNRIRQYSIGRQPVHQHPTHAPTTRANSKPLLHDLGWGKPGKAESASRGDAIASRAAERVGKTNLEGRCGARDDVAEHTVSASRGPASSGGAGGSREPRLGLGLRRGRGPVALGAGEADGGARGLAGRAEVGKEHGEAPLRRGRRRARRRRHLGDARRRRWLARGLAGGGFGVRARWRGVGGRGRGQIKRSGERRDGREGGGRLLVWSLRFIRRCGLRWSLPDRHVGQLHLGTHKSDGSGLWAAGGPPCQCACWAAGGRRRLCACAVGHH